MGQIVRGFASDSMDELCDEIEEYARIANLKIEKIKEYSKLAEEQLKENETIIIDSDSLNFGRKEAHKLDMEILKELLGE